MPGQTLSVAGCYYSYPPKGEIPSPGPSWPVSQVVKTPPFHGGNAGSIPARATMATKEGTKIQQGASPYEETAWPSMLKWMEQADTADSKSVAARRVGSNPTFSTIFQDWRNGP